MADRETATNPYIMSAQEAAARTDGPPAREEDAVAREEEARRAAEADMSVEIIDSVRGTTTDPITPVRLGPDDTFRFACHKGVACWNECCHNTDITLSPFDILRLSHRLNLRPAEFLARFALPAIWDKAGLPVARLRMADEGEGAARRPCVFLHDEAGCTVYEDRPVSCRYYPLGLAAVKMKGHEAPEDFYFLVREAHCKGHDEAHEQTVGEFRRAQGVEPYDEQNRGWIHMLMKMTSWKTLGGPWGKEPDAATRKMFFMATTDVDAFRRFVFETRFLDTYEIDEDMVERLRSDDELVQRLAFDWLRNVLFNEPTIRLKEAVLQQAITRARRDLGAG